MVVASFVVASFVVASFAAGIGFASVVAGGLPSSAWLACQIG